MSKAQICFKNKFKPVSLLCFMVIFQSRGFFSSLASMVGLF